MGLAGALVGLRPLAFLCSFCLLQNVFCFFCYGGFLNIGYRGVVLHCIDLHCLLARFSFRSSFGESGATTLVICSPLAPVFNAEPGLCALGGPALVSGAPPLFSLLG